MINYQICEKDKTTNEPEEDNDVYVVQIVFLACEVFCTFTVTPFVKSKSNVNLDFQIEPNYLMKNKRSLGVYWKCFFLTGQYAAGHGETK